MHLKTQINSFADLNIRYKKHNFNNIPIDVHIKDIQPKGCDEIEIGVFQSDMDYEYVKLKEIEEIKRNFKFINVKDKLYNNFSKNFLEYNNMEDIEELIYMGYDEGFFNDLNNHIDEIKRIVLNEYTRRLNIMFELNIEPPVINIKDRNIPQQINEYMKKDINYLIGQMGIEYNGTIYFDENIGKGISDWSFRELKLHLAYLTIKNRKEETSKKLEIFEHEKQVKEMERNRKK